MKKLILFILLSCVAFGKLPDALTHYVPNQMSETKQVKGNPCEVTPSYDPLPGNQVDVGLSLEFLWWYNKVTETTYATKRVVGANLVPLLAEKKESFDAKWNPGLRVGLSFAGFRDGWDLQLNWTYYHSNQNRQNATAPLPADPVPPGTEGYTSKWLSNLLLFSQMNAHLQLLWNQIDLTMGRKFWIGKWLVVHPFMGLRGFDSHLDFRVKGTQPETLGAISMMSASHPKQSFFAVGLLTGSELSWYFHPNGYLKGGMGLSLLYGKNKIKNRYDQNNVILATGESSFLIAGQMTTYDAYQTQTIIDLGMGLGWEKICFSETIRLDFSVSWENHYLVHFNRLLPVDVYGEGRQPGGGNLTLSGLVVRGRIDF